MPRRHGALAFFAGSAVLLIAVTGPLDAAVATSFSAHMVQHLLITMVAPPLLLLATAVLFWMPIVRADPSPSTLSYPARILYLFVAMPAMAFLGLVLVSAEEPLYGTYARVEGTARAIADQQVAGGIMWAGTMVLIVPALAFVLLDWMRADEREARRADERLARTAARSA